VRRLAQIIIDLVLENSVATSDEWDETKVRFLVDYKACSTKSVQKFLWLEGLLAGMPSKEVDIFLKGLVAFVDSMRDLKEEERKKVRICLRLNLGRSRMCDCGYGVRFGGQNLDETGEGVRSLLITINIRVRSLQKEIPTFNLSFAD